MTRELLAALTAPRSGTSASVGAGVPDGPLSDAQPANGGAPVGEGLAPPADPRSGSSVSVGEGLAPPADSHPGTSASVGAGVLDGPLAFPLRGRCPSAHTGADEVPPDPHPGTSAPVGAGVPDGPLSDAHSGSSVPVGEGLAPPADPRSGTSVSAGAGVPDGPLAFPLRERCPSAHTGADEVLPDPHPGTSAPVGAGVPDGPLSSAQPAASAPALPDLRAHLAALAAEAASIPGFDLAAALRDPDFVRLTAPAVGVGVRRAWDALHGDQLRRAAAEESARLLAQSVAQGLARPREGGGQTGAPPALDYRSLSRGEQLRLKERIVAAAARGEKLYP